MNGARSPGLIDFHCHLDLYEDFDQVVEDCRRYRIETLAVTTTPKAWPRNRELLQNHENIRVALGLHPQLVEERHREIELFEKYLIDTRYVGEIGLDAGPRHFRSLDLQKNIFARVLKGCAALGNKILSVHSVRATSNVLDLIEENMPSGRGIVILHWFSGTKAELRRATELGCFFSVNRRMLQPGPRLGTIAAMPIDRLLTETDGPFIKLNEEPIRPSSISETVTLLAQVWTKSSTEMAEILSSNLLAVESL